MSAPTNGIKGFIIFPTPDGEIMVPLASIVRVERVGEKAILMYAMQDQIWPQEVTWDSTKEIHTFMTEANFTYDPSAWVDNLRSDRPKEES